MRLVPVIAQDVRSNQVLMLAFADREAVRRSLRTGFMHYWSRSRKKYWRKGETSGHLQRLRSLHWDCDRDTLLARVEQTGPACHRGTPTCFGAGFPDILEVLETVVAGRRMKAKRGSYTNRLLADPALLRDEIVEEACELAMASRGGRESEIVGEAADVLYHVLVLLGGAGVPLADVKAELARRHRP